MYGQRASAAAAGFDRNLYIRYEIKIKVLRNDDNAFSRRLRLSSIRSIRMCNQRLPTPGKYCVAAVAVTVNGVCVLEMENACLLSMQKNLLLIFFFFSFRSRREWLLLATVEPYETSVQYGNRHFAMATPVNRFLRLNPIKDFRH